MISGSNRGIGKSIAERLIKDGHNISLGIRSKEFTSKEINYENNNSLNNILISEYEARDNKTATNWINKTYEKFGTIDTLIHCAGIFKSTGLIIENDDFSDIDDLWKINVLAPWYLTSKCWPFLLRNQNSRIVVLVSMSGKRSKGNLAGYCTSKFALMGLCQNIRNEGWKYGIRVTAICPSWVNTDMAKNITVIDKSEMTQPYDIADIVSTTLNLRNSSVPFEICINCQLEAN